MVDDIRDQSVADEVVSRLQAALSVAWKRAKIAEPELGFNLSTLIFNTPEQRKAVSDLIAEHTLRFLKEQGLMESCDVRVSQGRTDGEVVVTVTTADPLAKAMLAEWGFIEEPREYITITLTTNGGSDGMEG